MHKKGPYDDDEMQLVLEETTQMPDGGTCTVRAYRPVLTQEEYNRRHKKLEQACAAFYRACIKELSEKANAPDRRQPDPEHKTKTQKL